MERLADEVVEGKMLNRGWTERLCDFYFFTSSSGEHVYFCEILIIRNLYCRFSLS